MAIDLKSKSPPPPKQIDRTSWTIDEWCAMRGFKRGLYYKLRKAGKAPRVIYALSKPLVTAEADAAWVAAREAEVSNWQ